MLKASKTMEHGGSGVSPCHLVVKSLGKSFNLSVAISICKVRVIIVSASWICGED